MANGSFKGLYTFQQVANIYGLDNSTLRKQVSNGKLIDNVEVKKFGKTWLITEQSMIKHFGIDEFNLYIGRITLDDLDEVKQKKIKKKMDKKSELNELKIGI
ncbi:helix-turn-helix domain-containing protein (plasmid) [Paraclostridium bifermentans]|uniref:Helix-turn-helix domain-containing protein n=1 Tax=Paraclostridium bifermentans TaxID=1490 RepID=A0ABY8R7V1_PARBF|nr:helix-turn-helix domain-containing protein [Paraclostridium bifermentans]